jgi:dienelactone hydrolase
MVTVVVWHSVFGRRPAVGTFADALRGDGHEVVVPDLFEGRTFDDYGPAIAERDRLGFTTLLDRAAQAVADLPDELVHVGFSMGTAPATLTAAQRPGARGLVLVQGALPPAALGLDAWPDGLPVQLHTSPGDPWQPDEEVAQLVAAVPDGLLEHHEYPGTDHLFVDEDLPVHEPDAAGQLLARTQRWLQER